MKKVFIISYSLSLIAILFQQQNSFSQNVGIGLTNPTRAKLEVNGTVGYTTAIFGGETTGIGILQNNPGIGFNDYFSSATHKYIANGYSGAIWFDAVNGGMFFDVNGYGTANTAPTTGINSMVISNAGNVGIRTYQTLDASLFVVKAGNASGSAVFSGTNYASFFHNSVNEDTYIRGGKNSSTVFINDIPNGNIQLGNGSTKVGINTLPYAPLTALEINGAISLRAGVTTVLNGGTVTVDDRSYISITNGSEPVFSQFFLSNGISPGQILILQGNQTNIHYVYINDSPNSNVDGTMTLGKEDTLMLIWSGAKWIEVSRSNNAF